MMNDNKPYDRHAELVDKKFLSGLSEAETEELRQIRRCLDKLEAKWYAPTMALLRRLARKLC